MILGGVGSGKSSSSGFQLALGMLNLGYGGVVVTVKTDEAERWKAICKLAGRENDLVIFDEEHGHSFNALNYLIQLQGTESGLTENFVYLFESLAEIGDRASGGSSEGGEQFWVTARRELLRNTVDLLTIVLGELSPNFVLEVIRDAPQSLAEADSPEWQARSIIFRLLLQAEQMPLGEGSKHDLRQVANYFLHTWPRVATKTRSIIEASLSGFLDVFTRGKLYRLYCRSKSTVTPDDVLNGKIVVINQPIKRDQLVGYLSQTLWKTIFQQRVEMRRPGEDRPVFLFLDEAQNLLSIRDQQFLATARSSKVANVWLTQNLPNIFAALGDEGSRSRAESILSLAQTKVFHQNACPITNSWASELIGKRKIRMRNSSVALPSYDIFGFTDGEDRITAGSSQAYEYVLQPHVFTTLTKGGRHGFAQAIVFQGGKLWRGSGENYLRTKFKQGT